MGNIATDVLKDVQKSLEQARGPSFWSRWVGWQYTSAEQNTLQNIQNELITILNNNPVDILTFNFFNINFLGTQTISFR